MVHQSKLMSLKLYLEHIPYGYVEEDSLRWQILGECSPTI